MKLNTYQGIFLLFAAVTMIVGCIDPIEFDTGDEPRRLVVDGFITNNSWSAREEFPAPAQPFNVALRWTSEVNNEFDELINDAQVLLVDSEGRAFEYLWSPVDEHYVLPDPDFSAQPGLKYYLQITLANGEVYESEKEELHVVPPINSLDVNHTSRIKEIQVGPETEFVQQRGVELSVNIPEHGGETRYYRWKVTPSWVYETSLLPEGHPNKTCFVTNKFYFQKINVRRDRSGGYAQELFFLDTEDNERVEQDFSALITQYSLTPEAYKFWEDLALQQEVGGGIFDPPPFPLTSNIRNVNDPEEKVSGFFMVAHESVMRWYINMDELPYVISFTDRCEPIPGIPFIPPKGCLNCLEYPGGQTLISNQKPVWWREYQ
jgi:hypothetical protein